MGFPLEGAISQEVEVSGDGFGFPLEGLDLGYEGMGEAYGQTPVTTLPAIASIQPPVSFLDQVKNFFTKNPIALFAGLGGAVYLAKKKGWLKKIL